MPTKIEKVEGIAEIPKEKKVPIKGRHPPWTKEDNPSAEGHARMREIREETGKWPGSDQRTGRLPWRKRMTRWDWDRVYVVPAFGKDGLLFWQMYRALEEQYVPEGGGSNPQYEMMIRECAYINAQLVLAEARKEKAVVLDSYRRHLREYIAQLQKYTESLKYESTIRSEVIERSIKTFVNLVDAHVPMGHRGPVLRALQAAITGGEMQEEIKKLPGTQQLATRVGLEDVIDQSAEDDEADE